MKKRPNLIPIRAAATILAIAMLAGAQVAYPEEDARPVPGDSEEARAIVINMATFLAAQQSFRVDIASAHDTVQPTGQKIEFLDKRELVVRRPRELRMDTVRSDGERSRVVMNASTITAQHLTDNLYAQIPARASLDDSLKFFISELHMRLPLAMLLLSDAPRELEKRIVQAELVETTTIFDKPAHHISGSTDTVDFQLWISTGKQPLPQRIVLTYRYEEGEPQFRATFSDWKLSPWISSSTFQPRLEKDAQRIAFLTQIKTPPAAADAAAAKGEAR